MRFFNKKLAGTSGLLHFYDDILVQSANSFPAMLDW